jgi:hypothetical protein
LPSWAAFSLGSAALSIVMAVPLLILRYEKRALAIAASEIANSEIRALIESVAQSSCRSYRLAVQAHEGAN